MKYIIKLGLHYRNKVRDFPLPKISQKNCLITKRNSYYQGFTLLELMICVAVLAILAMLAAPSFGSLIDEKKLDRNARELAAVLAEARGKASTLRNNITVQINQPTCETSATTMCWKIKDPAISMRSNNNDIKTDNVIFNPIGVPQSRGSYKIDNPAYIPTNPTDESVDPPINPPRITVQVPLKFELCNVAIGQGRVILLSINGTVQTLHSVECA